VKAGVCEAGQQMLKAFAGAGGLQHEASADVAGDIEDFDGVGQYELAGGK
jgi:hypothetical protein